MVEIIYSACAYRNFCFFLVHTDPNAIAISLESTSKAERIHEAPKNAGKVLIYINGRCLQYLSQDVLKYVVSLTLSDGRTKV